MLSGRNRSSELAVLRDQIGEGTRCHCGRELRAVWGGAVFGAVIQDDAVARIVRTHLSA